MINSMMLHSFPENAGIRQLTKVLKICWHIHLFRSCFSNMGSFRYVLVFLNFFVLVLWVTNLTILHDIFSVNTVFYWWETYRSSRPEVFCEKGVLGNFTKITWKHLCQSLFFNKIAGVRPAILLKNRLWHRFFILWILWNF